MVVITDLDGGSKRAEMDTRFNLESLHEVSHASTHLNQDYGYPDVYTYNDTKNGSRTESKTSSEYHSQHSIDPNGLAYGGQFTSTASWLEKKGTFNDLFNNVHNTVEHPDPEHLVINQLDDHLQSYSEKKESASEEGHYHDVATSGGGSKRLQGGTFDRVFEIGKVETENSHFYETATNVARDIYPFVVIDTTKRSKTEDDQVTTTDGSYDLTGLMQANTETERHLDENRHSFTRIDHPNGWSEETDDYSKTVGGKDKIEGTESRHNYLDANDQDRWYYYDYDNRPIDQFYPAPPPSKLPPSREATDSPGIYGGLAGLWHDPLDWAFGGGGQRAHLINYDNVFYAQTVGNGVRSTLGDDYLAHAGGWGLIGVTTGAVTAGVLTGTGVTTVLGAGIGSSVLGGALGGGAEYAVTHLLARADSYLNNGGQVASFDALALGENMLVGGATGGLLHLAGMAGKSLFAKFAGPKVAPVQAIAERPVAQDIIGSARKVVPRSAISENPANKLVETGIPRKDGGWARRWVRMNNEDYAQMLRERSEFYDHISDLGERMRLSPEAGHNFRFEQMGKFRQQWLRDFLENRSY